MLHVAVQDDKDDEIDLVEVFVRRTDALDDAAYTVKFAAGRAVPGGAWNGAIIGQADAPRR
jgi:hypothetical protein